MVNFGYIQKIVIEKLKEKSITFEEVKRLTGEQTSKNSPKAHAIIEKFKALKIIKQEDKISGAVFHRGENLTD